MQALTKTPHTDLREDQAEKYYHIEIVSPGRSNDLAEIAFIGPADRIEHLKRVAALLEFEDANAVTSADDIIDAMTPARCLQGCRGLQGLSQSGLAEKVGTSQGYISEMENGSREITVSMAKKLAAVLKCDYKDLL